MKRYVGFILIIAIISSICIPAFAADSPSSWAQNGVKAAISTGIVPKSLQDSWQKKITRAEFCNLIVSLLEKRGYDFDKNNGWKSIKFADTNNLDAKKARFLNIVDGKKTDSSGIHFYPNDPVTRQETAKMLYALTFIKQPLVIPAAVKAQLAPHVFDDRNAPPQKMKNGMEYSYIASWARECIDFCYNSGIMEGSSNNHFDPNGSLTREQACITILKMYQWAANGGNYSKASDNRYLYHDSKTGLYGYKDINGNVVIPAKYEDRFNTTDSGEFKNGHAVVKQGENLAIIDKSGNTVALNNKWNGIFDDVTILSSSRAHVVADNWKTNMLISLPEGKIIEENCAVGDSCLNGWYRYSDNKNYGYMDQNGNIVIKAQFAQAGDFYNGVAVVFKNGETNPYLINKSGQIISKKCGIDFSKYSYSTAWGKYIMVRLKNSGGGVISFEGKSILPFDNINIRMTHDGHFITDKLLTFESYLYDCNGVQKTNKMMPFNGGEVCYGRYAFAFANSTSANGDGYYRLTDENGKKINDIKMSDVVGDGGSALLYQIYIDPEDNDTGLAVPEGSWAVVIDDTGKELWRTRGLNTAGFANGAIRIVRPNGNIEYYTPNGRKIV